MENTTGTIRLGSENFEFPIIEGTEGEKALDTRTLRAKSGCITFDEGYGNTGSCISDITFINGEKGNTAPPRLCHRRTRGAFFFSGDGHACNLWITTAKVLP